MGNGRLALRYLDPEGYYDLIEKVSKKEEKEKAYIQGVIDLLKNKLKANIEGDIKGRAKHFYSIYRKMKYQSKSFEEIYDLMAVKF